jgi:hypothetical protein
MHKLQKAGITYRAYTHQMMVCRGIYIGIAVVEIICKGIADLKYGELNNNSRAGYIEVPLIYSVPEQKM